MIAIEGISLERAHRHKMPNNPPIVFRLPREVLQSTALAVILISIGVPSRMRSEPHLWQLGQSAEVLLPSTAERRAGFEQRLKLDPGNRVALAGLAQADTELRDFPAAIVVYRRMLAANPGDRAIEIQIARLLGWNRQYSESTRAFTAMLVAAPNDQEALEGLAKVQLWSGRPAEAAVTYGSLAAAYPGDPGYLFEAARLEAGTHQYPAARDRLTLLLALEPGNVDARLLLAQLELKQGQTTSSLRQFERVLGRRPGDPAALMGAAEARYYSGDLNRAYAEASEVCSVQPQNFDALFLLASIERARGHRARARALLSHANRLSSHNPEVAGLREKLWADSSTVLHLTAGYSRELGSAGSPEIPASLVEEDLRSFVFDSILDFTVLPRTRSSFSFNSMPTESPSGIIGGAVAPTGFLYRQTTRVNSRLTVRGGVGLEHFGPGLPVNLPNSAGPQPGATITPIGFIGGSFAATEQLSFDLTWSRSAITYTPLAVRLGVVSTRIEGGVNIAFDPRTDLHLTYFRDHFTTESFEQTASPTGPLSSQPEAINMPDEERGTGGAAVFNHRIVNREPLAIDAGWSTLLLGYDGPRRDVFLGFFTPAFYQRDLGTARLSGRFSKRLGYDLSTGAGIQQVDSGGPFKRALMVNPAVTFKATPYLSGTLGYAYYDSAQALGIVRGNGVRLGLDIRF